jgi:uroporphyrinogen decarboxylase
VLFAGWDAVAAATDAVLDEASGLPGHVFNLGHGVLPGTDPDVLTRVVERVHERTARAG